MNNLTPNKRFLIATFARANRIADHKPKISDSFAQVTDFVSAPEHFPNPFSQWAMDQWNDSIVPPDELLDGKVTPRTKFIHYKWICNVHETALTLNRFFGTVLEPIMLCEEERFMSRISMQTAMLQLLHIPICSIYPDDVVMNRHYQYRSDYILRNLNDTYRAAA